VLRITALTSILCLSTLPASAHPFHVSVAELEYQPSTSTLEVALRLFPEDLETALRQRSRRRVHLERTRGIDRLIVEYLRERFVVADSRFAKNREVAPIRWVGKEVDPRHAWLYFEVILTPGRRDWTIQNRVLFEVIVDQENTIRVKDGERRYALSFTRQRPSASVRFDSTNGKDRVQRSDQRRGSSREQPGLRLESRCSIPARRHSCLRAR